MIFTAVVLVPTKLEIHADNRVIASEEAREWARQQQSVGEYIAKVLTVQLLAGQEPPPKRAA